MQLNCEIFRPICCCFAEFRCLQKEKFLNSYSPKANNNMIGLAKTASARGSPLSMASQSSCLKHRFKASFCAFLEPASYFSSHEAPLCLCVFGHPPLTEGRSRLSTENIGLRIKQTKISFAAFLDFLINT